MSPFEISTFRGYVVAALIQMEWDIHQAKRTFVVQLLFQLLHFVRCRFPAEPSPPRAIINLKYECMEFPLPPLTSVMVNGLLSKLHSSTILCAKMSYSDSSRLYESTVAFYNHVWEASGQMDVRGAYTYVTKHDYIELKRIDPTSPVSPSPNPAAATPAEFAPTSHGSPTPPTRRKFFHVIHFIC